MRDIEKLVCKECGKTFSVRPYRKNIAKYCSRDCHNRAKKKEGMPDYCRKAQLEWMKVHTHGEFKESGYGLNAVHRWAERRITKPDKCPSCGIADIGIKRSYFQLSNINHEYRRDINDYQWLCRKCHYEYDTDVLGIKRIGRFI